MIGQIFFLGGYCCLIQTPESLSHLKFYGQVMLLQRSVFTCAWVKLTAKSRRTKRQILVFIFLFYDWNVLKLYIKKNSFQIEKYNFSATVESNQYFKVMVLAGIKLLSCLMIPTTSFYVFVNIHGLLWPCLNFENLAK